MARVISIISGKGGVGKTTTATNLGAALAGLGKSVIVVDINVTTPNLSLHLGIPFSRKTLHDVLRGEAHISEAIYTHESGFKVVPASLSAEKIKNINLSKIQAAVLSILNQADIILLDSAAGLGREAQTAIDVADEIIVITNPEMPAVADALKTINIAKQKGTKLLGVVLNRVKNSRHELSIEKIENMLDAPILAVVPEDDVVPKSIAAKRPAILHKPRSACALEFKKLAKTLLGEPQQEYKRQGFFQRIFGWMV